MFYEVVEIETEDSEFKLTYSLVRFWRSEEWHDAGKRPDNTESFLSNPVSTGVRIVTDENGWRKRLSDGVFVDPTTLPIDDRTQWERESYTIDVPSRLIEEWEEYWVKYEDEILAGQRAADTADRTVRLKDTTERDPVITRSDVASLRGTKRTGTQRRIVRGR